MLKNQKIQVKIYPSNINYYKQFLKCSINDIVFIEQNILPEKSNMIVDCVCDECSKEYSVRRSRNINHCKKCSTRLSLTGNTFGKANSKYSIPDSNHILNFVKQGHGIDFLAKHYRVSTPVVKRWLKELKIELPSYYGRKFFKTSKEEQDAIDIICKNSGMNIRELSNLAKIPVHIINKLRNEKKIDIKTQFDVWNERYINILNNMDFYVSENQTKNLMDISHENNISIEQLKRAFKENNIKVRLHSYNKSKGELEIIDFIKSLGDDCFSAMFDKTYEIDCYVPAKKFGIEYCGEYWHRYNPEKDNKNYHKKKMNKALNDQSIDIMTIFESEWKSSYKRKIIESMIIIKLGYAKKIPARACQIMEISKQEAEEFHNKNHIAGSTNSSINIGLFFKKYLVAVISLIRSRFDKKYEYEISRFSSIKNHIIVGGLSKLFSYFVKTYQPKSCLTFADLRFGRGKSYEKIGFAKVGETVPNYFYFDKINGVMETRHKYQKHKLKKFPNYSPFKTEFEIMNENGFFRIYDCGNMKYEWIEKSPA